jgi:nucleotide-binding universal stress UspA family protein
MKVLIGYDGSRSAKSAFDDLIRAGLPDKGEALIISVAEVWLPPSPSPGYKVSEKGAKAQEPLSHERKYMTALQVVKDAEEMASRAAAQFRSKFPGWKVKHEATSGSPTWELFSNAEKWKADLIVVGSHGRSALGRFFLGSVSQWLLNEARCSVRIARGKLAKPDFPIRLVLGIDGSTNANLALKQVATRNWSAKSEVRVVVVEQPLQRTAADDLISGVKLTLGETNQKYFQGLANAAVKRLKAAGLHVTGLVAQGDPKHLLVRIAEEWRADCIFLGGTGVSNRLERFLLGSVAGAVAARAHCSVEIVRKRSSKRKKRGKEN